MRRHRPRIDKNTERAVYEILRSKAKTTIYIYLLKKNGARAEEIIRGTKLHPSTVRELLSKMYEQQLIYREKIKNHSIGKNPYMYHPIPPIHLLKKHVGEIEDRLNRIASLGRNIGKDRSNRCVRIKIYEQVET
ncbi:TrmB family transcriptional regulator [Euryarchaeota archaeon ex4484_162]|nr:MAG: TrmB family transcriptional regulator [Euryarchaeota archaeon ex4484_162]RLF27919.1 MAG: TrmB family transcriptional regulator [Thermoplasmata archaeon]RLF34652.1 MAG: TrmB family transcriptional regulator [Thermoplasmata archaeon]